MQKQSLEKNEGIFKHEGTVKCEGGCDTAPHILHSDMI